MDGEDDSDSLGRLSSDHPDTVQYSTVQHLV